MATSRKPVLSEQAIVIVVCTIIIRVLSIGYVIGGFVVKFHLPFLDEGVVYVLDKINLGVLPLGSTLMFLFYSMMPFLLLYTIVGVIGLTLIYKTTKLLLIMHAIIHTALTALEIVYLSLISWIISETYYATEQDYVLAHDAASSQWNWIEDKDKWSSFFEKLECCNVTGKQTINRIIGNNGYTCKFSTGCLDVIQSFTTTYGSYYIAIISVNIITSLVAVGVTEYMYRTVVIKNATDKKMTRCSNGMFGELHKFFLSFWRRNKIIWMSGMLKIFDFMYEVALGTSLLILTFSWFRDYYLKDVIWNIWKDGISMGYLEYVLTVTFLCVLLVSMGLKILNFTAIHQKKRNLMITYMISEFFLLLIEVIIFIFFIFLIRMLYCCLTGNESYHCHFSDSDQRNTLCSNNEGIWERSVRNIWLSFAFLLFHITVKLSQLVMNERIFKVISSEEKGEAGGFLYFLFVRSKKASLAAANLGLGVFIMVYSTIFLCGLLIVRYDQHSYSRITSTLHGLYHNGTSLNIGTVRDASYIMMAVSSSLSFLAQILLYVGLYFQISKLFLCFFGVQFSLLLPQMISVILIGFPLRLVYCCLDGTDYSQCEFHSNKDDLKILCNGGSDLWISAVREIWLFWAFTLGSFVVQVISLVLCNTFYQKTFNGAGVFTLCWRFIKQKVGRLKTKVLEHPVTSIVVLAVVTLIIEVGFGITVYVYFFVNVDHTQVQQNTGELSRHIYNMRYLMNGIVYTLMVITPISAILRPILFWLILFKRKLLLSYFFVLGFIVLVIAELVMLAQSSFLLHWAKSCGSLGAFDATDWAEFCRSYDGVVYNMAVINISFMVLHLIFNTLHIILVDRTYPVLKEDEKRRGILKICFTFIWDRIKSLFTKEKIQRFFTTIQGFSIIVEVAYGVSVYALYFANFSPIDNTLQQELATFGKHRYDMQDLLNALSYTLMSFIPLLICLRVIILLTSIYKRPLFIYIIMLSIFVISVGEIVLLSQSSYILDMAYDCFIRGSAHYAIYEKFSLFCNTNVRFVFDIAAVLVSFLVLHIVLNGISIIILDQMYKHAEDGSSAKGAIVTAFSLLFASLKTSKIIAVFIVTLLLMLVIRLLFWTGLILMGLSPGYIHTGLIDTLYSMHRGDMNYGRLVMGLLYSHMAMVPLDIACHFWEFFAVLKPRKLRLCSGVIIRIPWVCSDVVCLVLSSIVLRLWHCLCGSGINCSSSFPSHKTEVCQHSDLLFDSSGIMVAYVVINFACHVLEMILIGFLIKRGIPKVSPTDISLNNQEDVNSSRGSVETIAV